MNTKIAALKSKRLVALGALPFFLALTTANAAPVDTSESTSVQGAKLEDALTGVTKQNVMKLDKTGLKLVLNEEAGEVLLEGWSTKTLTDVQKDALLDQFGVRTVYDPSKGTGVFYAPSDVGRAGILDGTPLLKLNGKIYKGLTLKGYGGNQNGANFRGEQPDGSLEFNESTRDMEVSKILSRNNVDTYVGIISVERPNGKSNYVRISRTALRMNHLIDMRGDDLKKVVNYLTDLLHDELGKKLSTTEFYEWIVKKSGDLMARKDHIRFTHASITTSNLGIGELVDLGDSFYNTGMSLPGEYTSQNASFKNIVQSAASNLSQIDSTIDSAKFNQLYDEAYNTRLAELQAQDKGRLNLSKASEAELVTLGFTQTEAAEIAKFAASNSDGILDPAELKSVQGIARDIDAILDRTTTDFLALSDGTKMAQYYVESVGGAAGVRELLGKARDYMKANSIQVSRKADGTIDRAGNVAQLEAELERLALEKSDQLGFARVRVGESVTRFSKFVSRQLIEVIARR